MSFSVSTLADEICNLVIRPQRCKYDPSIMLGPKLFMLGNKIYERKDVIVENKRKMKLQCSHYMPIESQRQSEKLPCVIYLHGNCGSRCDALDTVQILLPYNITVFAFDFAGSGLSEGEYVTLGFYEQEDVHAVMKYLRDEGRTSKIGIWGRSMGAATAIIVAEQDQDISGIVCDSPFTTLEDVIVDLVKSHQKWIPKNVVKVGIKLMRKRILNRAKFDIRKNTPINYAKKAEPPVLFGAAYGDTFINIRQSEQLYEVYGGEKDMVRFDGDHNSERPDFFYEAVSIFFYNVLISNDRTLEFKEPGKLKSRPKDNGPPTPELSKSASFKNKESSQMLLPKSLTNVDDESYLNDIEMQKVMIASVKERLENCKDELEKKDLEKRLADLEKEYHTKLSQSFNI